MGLWETAADWHSSDLFATVESSNAEPGRIASVWSFQQRRRLACYPVRWDAGGHRSAMADGCVVTARYGRGRVTCYDALTSAERWQASVSMPQQIQVYQGVVFAAGEKDLRRLRLSDGELLGRVPNLKHVAADPNGNGFAAEYGGAGRPVRCYGSDAEVAWSRTAWRWLSSVWAPAGLLVGFPRFYHPVPVPGDSVGQVWCLEPGTGAKLWEWKAPPSAHVVACGYREHGTQFIGLLYYYDIPRPLEQELLLWSAGGDLLERHTMPIASPGSWTIDVACFNRGDWLVGAGYVLDVSTGEVLWRFNSADAGQGG